MSRGGARSGAGRKPRTDKVRSLTFRIRQELYEQLPARGKAQMINDALERYFKSGD